MGGYFLDLGIFAITLIVITAFMGSIFAFIAKLIFGRKNNTSGYDYTQKTQVGWKSVGGGKL